MSNLTVEQPFVDRARELAALERFWRSGRAECIPVTGRRRVGKTFLLEHFSEGKRTVYYRCQLRGSDEQVAQLGAQLAAFSGDSILLAQPPATWSALFATLERLAEAGRLLVVLDELPYWVARDESLPSILQNWWDERGRATNLMLVLCGSAVQMMERLLTGPAPLAGCATGRLVVRPLDFRAAAELVGYTDPVDALTAYGILGGISLYLSFFRPAYSIRQNIAEAIANPSARLYVEPQAVFAAHHESYNPVLAMRILRALARGEHRWSNIAQAAGLTTAGLTRPMERLIGDLGLVERVLPVTETRESRTYFTQYHLSDHFFRFWFRFIEPNQGHIEFGDADYVVDAIMAGLSEYLGLAFETICHDWVRQASATGALPVRVGRVGSWWNGDHQLDVVVDDDGRAAICGECKWQVQPLDWNELERYLGHVQALGALVRPDVTHLLFSKSGHTERVQRWADQVGARLLTPAKILAPLSAS